MNHYVYEITNIINNKKYIGKRSCNCSIEDDKYMGSGIAINNAERKYGIENFKKTIIKILNSEKEAFNYEKYWIKECNAVESRMYYNIKDGGEGNSSEDAKRFMKNLSDEKRKIRSEKLSIANTGKSNSMYGKVGKQNPVSKSVVMLSAEDGKLLMRFECIREANAYLGNSKAFSFISRVCINKSGIAYDYFWLFEQDYNDLVVENKFQDWLEKTILKYKRRLNSKYQYNDKPVYMLNRNTYNVIKQYKNVTEASKDTNIKASCLLQCCNHENNRNSLGGYSWIFIEEYKKLNKNKINEIYKHKFKAKPIEKYVRKAVICLTTGQTFKSQKDAKEYFTLCNSANIAAVCKGKRATCGKHPKTGQPLVWEYYNSCI